MNSELDELGSYLIQLKKETENQKKIIEEFKAEREHLIEQIKKLDKIVDNISSTYGKEGEKILDLVDTKMSPFKDGFETKISKIDSNLSKFMIRLDKIESQLKIHDSDIDDLSSKRKGFLKELEDLENAKEDISELEKWKQRASERLDDQDQKIDEKIMELGNLEDRVKKYLEAIDEKLDNVNKDLSELEKWKRHALESIGDQDKKIDDRMMELGNLEDRVENSLEAIDGKLERAIKDQRTYSDEQIKKLELKIKELSEKQKTFIPDEKLMDVINEQKTYIDDQMSKLESKIKKLKNRQESLSVKAEEDVRDIISNEITPRILKIDNALTQIKKLNIIFQGLRDRTEKLCQRIITFKTNFENKEKDLKKEMEKNIKKIEEFEKRMTAFMNELVQEYEKRFEMVRSDMEKYVYPIPTRGSVEPKTKFKSEGVLNRMKKIFMTEDLEKDRRIAQLENELKTQKIMMKKLLNELKSVTEEES